MSDEFGEEFMKKREHIAWRGSIIAQVLIAVLNPKTVIDLGCGTGDIVRGLLDKEVEAYGVDNSSASMKQVPIHRTIFGDIREPLGHWLDSFHVSICPFDLVIILEVLSIVKRKTGNEDFVSAQRMKILDNARVLGETILINHLEWTEEDLLKEHGFKRNYEAEKKMQSLLSLWKDKQAMKALYRTGQIWKSRHST